MCSSMLSSTRPRSLISRRVSPSRLATALLLALAACAPLPDTGQRKLSSQGIRPGVTALALEGIASIPERQARYRIDTPLRSQPSEMAVTLRRGADGGYLREETVRIPETSAAEAQLVATMVRQRDGRKAEVVGTDVILRGTEQVDRRGRTLVAERGGVRTAFAPHDCRATLGTCRTVRTGPDGQGEPLVVETSELGGIWRETVRRDRERDPASRGKLLRESLYSLDHAGMLVDMNRMDHEKTLGQYQEIRRVE
jgi:hypothetical protein